MRRPGDCQFTMLLPPNFILLVYPQIEFLNLIIDHLTEHGSMQARLLYDSAYTDFSPRGVDGVFESKDVDELVSTLEDVRNRAEV